MEKKFKIDTFKLFLIACFLFSLFIATDPVWDNDAWWHIETGKYIVENKIVPKTDIFSFYGIENNFKWIAHEWLSDVVLYGFYHIGGFQGLVLYPIVLLFFTMFVLYLTIKEKINDNFIIGFICFYFTGLILAVFSATRPHMFSFLLFALTIYILQQFQEDKNTKLVWFLPLLSMLWVNFHGGSSALLFVMIVFTIIFNLISLKIGRLETIRFPFSKIKTLFYVFLASIGAALINPYGYEMLIYPFHNMADSLMLSSIIEWQSPDFHTPEGIIVFVILSIPVVISLISNKKLSVYELVIMGAFAFLTLKSIRQVTYYAMATLPISINHLLKSKFLEEGQFKVTKFNSILNTTFVIFAICLFTFNLYSTFKEPVDLEDYPYNAIPVIEEYQPKRLFNHYNWGGFLIFNLNEKGIHNFIDGRADIFSPTILKDYSKIHNMSTNWEDSFEKFDFDSVLFPSNSLLIRHLLNTGEWEVKHTDDLSTFLIRKN